MDDDGLNMRNWGYYEPSLKGNLGLQLMPSVVEQDTKSFLSVRDNPVMLSANGAFHPRDSAFSGALDHMDYVRDSWISHREKFLHFFPGNPYNAMLAEPSASHPMQMLQQPDAIKDSQVNVEEPSVRKEAGPAKKRTANASPKTPKAKKSKKGPSVLKENGNSSVQRAKATKKSIDVTINGIDMDISGIPIPVCTCTGSPQQCYRWGCGGWQSACCTTTISIYPLPMSTKRRGARIAGRKMSQGAFKKVLEKLAAEAYNFANPIDLKAHWAKHGTNKFVTISESVVYLEQKWIPVYFCSFVKNIRVKRKRKLTVCVWPIHIRLFPHSLPHYFQLREEIFPLLPAFISDLKFQP